MTSVTIIRSRGQISSCHKRIPNLLNVLRRWGVLDDWICLPPENVLTAVTRLEDILYLHTNVSIAENSFRTTMFFSATVGRCRLLLVAGSVLFYRIRYVAVPFETSFPASSVTLHSPTPVRLPLWIILPRAVSDPGLAGARKLT